MSFFLQITVKLAMIRAKQFALLAMFINYFLITQYVVQEQSSTLSIDFVWEVIITSTVLAKYLLANNLVLNKSPTPGYNNGPVPFYHPTVRLIMMLRL